MKKSLFMHEPKSYYAYNTDTETMHIKLRVIKGTANSVTLIYGEPFGSHFDDARQRFDWVLEEEKEAVMELYLDSSLYDYYFVSIKNPTKRIKYGFLINDQYFLGPLHLFNLKENPHERHNLSNFFNFPYLLQVDTYQAPNWVKDTIWYSIFPDSFNNFDNHKPHYLDWDTPRTKKNFKVPYGGNLKGITQKLDYLKSMGFTGIYLNPIFTSPSVHKYDTIDYFSIDPQFGSKADLTTLVDKAHSLGIKVMLDSVFNHVSYKHPFFQDVIEKGPKSPYYNGFFIHDWPINIEDAKNSINIKPNYETFAFTYRMPKLNTDHPLIRKHLIDVGTYWIKEFDIDGWRLDVSNEVPHDFWRTFRKAIKSIKPEAYLLGENWYNSYEWLKGDQHDGAMNYEFLFPIWSYFSTRNIETKISTETFIDTISNVIFSYPEHVIVNLFNLIDSHDTERIGYICSHNTNLIKLVYMMLYILPGAPSIYYGGEVGLSGTSPADARPPMKWTKKDQNIDLKQHIKQLNTLYHTHKSFRLPTLRWLSISDNILIIKKANMHVILNHNHKAKTIATASLPNTVLYTNALTIETDFVTLPPYGFHVTT